MSRLDDALEDLRRGRFVLVHDFESREDEIDLVVAAEFVKPKHVARMRTDAGGLICLAVDGELAEKIGLPFMVDVYRSTMDNFPLLTHLMPNDIKYDNRSSFSLTINHRKTYTGIPDIDRALTIQELGAFCRNLPENTGEAFGEKFRSPGHVHLLISSDLKNRLGHTELSTALLRMAGLTPVAAICEMLDSWTHHALLKTAAIKYAKEHNLILLDGNEVKKAYEKLQKVSSSERG
ncbi:MAG: 3,4-dihydroxy-2-butanone-4-phosphate synthase [Candidatus Altiarchaeota archaeon]|nr:3,4-dihydroxy-2-butanone-4-phosphate synthase [Candidatus Altiarchaeota archaeon]